MKFRLFSFVTLVLSASPFVRGGADADSSKEAATRSFAYYDDLFQQKHHEDFSSSTNNDTHSSPNVLLVNTEENETVRLAVIKALLPFTNGLDDPATLRPTAADDAFAVLLAVQAFHSLHPNCNVKMTLSFLDTQLSPTVATQTLVQQLLLQDSNKPSSSILTALLGASRSAVTAPTALLSSSVHQIPQISAASTSLDLDAKSRYKYFGRTVTNSVGEAAVAWDLFQQQQQEGRIARHSKKPAGANDEDDDSSDNDNPDEFPVVADADENIDNDNNAIVILFEADAYGSTLQKAFAETASSHQTRIVSIALHNDVENYHDSLAQVAQSQIRHIYAILYEYQLSQVHAAAKEYGLLGPEYFWVYPGLDLDALRGQRQPQQNLQLHQDLQGSAILTMEGGKPFEEGGGDDDDDDEREDLFSARGFFHKAWRDAVQNRDFTDYVQSKLPDGIGRSSSSQESAMLFSAQPGSYRPFLYDAVMALGISMCRAASEGDKDDDGTYMFSGPEIYEQFRHLNMEGASGRVRIDPATGTRHYESMHFIVWNVQPSLAKQEFQDAPFQEELNFVPVLFYNNGTWVSTEANRPFLYKDGTTNPPPALPPVAMNNNYIGTAARAVAYILMSITIASTLVFAFWLDCWHRSNRIIAIARPAFLLAVNLGVLVMACSIVPLSLDETLLESTAALDFACMSAPWMYGIGISLVMGAILAKLYALYRAYIDSEMEFVRVSTTEVVVAILVLLLLNGTVLIVWTLVDPLQWTRVETTSRDIFNRPTETYSQCSGSQESYSVVFASAFGAVNAAAVVLANFFSFRCRNIVTEYGESRYLGIAVVLILQAWFVGLPIFVAVWGNPEGRLLVSATIVFVTAQVVVSLVYVPKVVFDRVEAKEKQQLLNSVASSINEENRHIGDGSVLHDDDQ